MVARRELPRPIQTLSSRVVFYGWRGIEESQDAEDGAPAARCGGSAEQRVDPAEHDQGYACQRSADDVDRRSAVSLYGQVGEVPDRGSAEAQVRIVRQQRFAGPCAGTRDDPVVAVERNLGVDLLTAEGMAQLTPVLFEIFGGLFEPDALDRLRDTYQKGSAEVSLSI